MSKNINALVERVRDGWEPRAGDLVRYINSSDGDDLFLIVFRGEVPRSGLAEACVIFRAGRREEPSLWSISELDEVKGCFEFHGVSSDFYVAGFGPTSAHRPYVIFKRAAGAMLRAGCRSFSTYAQAARHWRSNGHAEMPADKRALAKRAFDEARRRGWLKVKRQPPARKTAKKRSR